MHPITPIQPHSRFRNYIKQQNKTNDDEEEFENIVKDLRQRLKNIRNGNESGPISNISPNDIDFLNRQASKRSRYGLSCPDCQNAYKKSAMRAREVVPFRSEDKKVEISS
jgi:hypothetical protein